MKKIKNIIGITSAILYIVALTLALAGTKLSLDAVVWFQCAGMFFILGMVVAFGFVIIEWIDRFQPRKPWTEEERRTIQDMIQSLEE